MEFNVKVLILKGTSSGVGTKGKNFQPWLSIYAEFPLFFSPSISIGHSEQHAVGVFMRLYTPSHVRLTPIMGVMCKFSFTSFIKPCVSRVGKLVRNMSQADGFSIFHIHYAERNHGDKLVKKIDSVALNKNPINI